MTDKISGWQPYTPTLIGATDNPTPTYSVQSGRYMIVGNICFFKIKLTTTTMTKTTLTDNIRVSLPVTAANVTSDLTKCAARVENATAVLNGAVGEIAPGTSYIQFRSGTVAAATALITYALLSLGVLTNTINFEASGFVEIA